MKKFSLFLFAAMAMIFASCENPNGPDIGGGGKEEKPVELAGTWQVTQILVNGEDKIEHYKKEGYADDLNLSTFTLQKDGKFSASFVYMKADPAQDRPAFTYDYEGTYVNTDGKVVFNTKEGTAEIEFDGGFDGKAFWLNQIPAKIQNSLLFWAGVDVRETDDYKFKVNFKKN